METTELAQYPFRLPPLPYEYGALEPYIDEETMHYHHDKHFQTYITNLNAALAPFPGLQKLTVPRLLQNLSLVPQQARTAVERNAGGVYNHDLFFKRIAPAAQVKRPSAGLTELIIGQFGSMQTLKERLIAEAKAVFGSGWAALTLNERGRLQIMGLANQETSLARGYKTVVLMDVWEHAYYLKYKNDRAGYLDNLWEILSFPEY